MQLDAQDVALERRARTRALDQTEEGPEPVVVAVLDDVPTEISVSRSPWTGRGDAAAATWIFRGRVAGFQRRSGNAASSVHLRTRPPAAPCCARTKRARPRA